MEIKNFFTIGLKLHKFYFTLKFQRRFPMDLFGNLHKLEIVAVDRSGLGRSAVALLGRLQQAASAELIPQDASPEQVQTYHMMGIGNIGLVLVKPQPQNDAQQDVVCIRAGMSNVQTIFEASRAGIEWSKIANGAPVELTFSGLVTRIFANDEPTSVINEFTKRCQQVGVETRPYRMTPPGRKESALRNKEFLQRLKASGARPQQVWLGAYI